MSDERAVEFGQFSQPGSMQPQMELVGYYEPTQIAELTRQGRLLVVADGIGGAASGEVAGRYAVQKILHDFYHSREPDLEKRLLEVIRQANKAILERNSRYPDRRAIATTLLAALIHQNKLLVANVGDGRAYVVWDQDIEHLTGENSSPQRLARETGANSASPAQEDTPAEASTGAVESGSPDSAPGELEQTSTEEKESSSPDLSEEGTLAKTSAEEAKSRLLAEKGAPVLSLTTLPPASSPRLLASPLPALGLAEQVEINLFSRRLFPGDMVVLCSGGLSGYTTEAEIAQIVTQDPAELASRRLAELAAKRGSRDTLSVNVTKVLAKPITQAAPTRQALPVAPDWEGLSKTSTRPLPPIVSQPPGRSQYETRRRWPIVAAAIAALVLFSLIGFLAGGYWLAPESTSLEPTLRNGEEQGLSQEDAAQGGVNGETSPIPTAQNQGITQTQPTLTPAGTLVAESNSPLPTPTESTSLQAGDVITPTPSRLRPTPAPTIALPPGCTNKARFAGDVTVKDGTQFAPGELFDKVWSVTNYGTCPWGGGYTVHFVEGDLMGASEEVPAPFVEPESTGAITVSMVAPDLPGIYRGNWQMVGLDGEPFGPDLYLEVEVVPGILRLDETELTTLYDFVANAAQATWSADGTAYTVVEAPVDRNLVIPDPQGIVVIGPAELRGDTESPGNVLMTHPHLELGFIEGTYPITLPLQPTDALIGSLGLPKAAAINDDGVTFEVSFKPANGPDQLLFSKSVKYEDSPVTVRQALTTIQPNQTGAFILRVKGGDSLSYDWATWIDLRLVRP
jgi:serine/threonine protein phosphatase PrpC